MRLTDLKEIQQAQLLIMDDIHRVCVKNGIRYYLIGGSAIGAIRHQGFIPWDVDIDIAMPREDYDLFVKIANTELNPKFRMLNHMNNPYLMSPHILVVLDNSTIVFKNDLLNPQVKRNGLYIDILPLDKVPIDKQQRKYQKNILAILGNIMGFRMMRNYESDTKVKHFLKKCLIPIIYKIPTTFITRLQHAVAQWGNNQPEYNELCSMLSHYTYDKLCMPNEWFGKPRSMKFEGRDYYVPQNIEAYLSKLFGNYMRLPPESEQERYMQMIYEATIKKSENS